MFGYYTPLLILQAFCLYHAYRNNVEQRWYWLIIFLPGVGCALYLYHHFYNRTNIKTITEGVKGVVNSNYRTEQLEEKLKFSDNVTNKVNLADEYVRVARYEEAVKLYQDCLTGYMEDDPSLMTKLLQACYLNQNYATAVMYGSKLESNKQFKSSVERASYAWSLYRNGNKVSADEVFKDLNKSFTNYKQRVEYGKYLMETGRPSDAKALISELREELDQMQGPEERLHTGIRREVNELRTKM